MAIANCIFLIIRCGRQFYSDTLSYIIAWDNIANGQIDKWRTPLYPLFLGSVKAVFGQELFPICAVVIQFLFFGVSIYFFYKLTNILLQSESISYWLTAFYALYPCIPTWNCFLITEPIAIYAIVFLLYSTIHAINMNSRLHIYLTSFWLFFLVFLRPALIYLIPVYLFGWLLYCINKKTITKSAVEGLIGILLVGLSLATYSFCFKMSYGMFAPSGIGTVNQYYIARIDGAIDPMLTENPNLKAYVENSIIIHGKEFSNGSSHDLYQEAIHAIDTYGLKDVSNLVSSSYMNDKKKYLKRICLHVHRAATDKLFDSFLNKFRSVIDIIGIRINFIYLILFFYTIFLMIKYKEKKMFPLFSSIIYLMGFCHLFVIIVGCQNEWFRLILPVVPCYLLMFGQLLSMLKFSRNTKMVFM